MCAVAHSDHNGSKHVCSDQPDFGLEDVLTLGVAEGWSRCPGCRTMVELNLGCYHMTCLCKVRPLNLDLNRALIYLSSDRILLPVSSQVENLPMYPMGRKSP